MRKITASQIFVFSLLVVSILLLAWLTAGQVIKLVPPGDFRPIVLLAVLVVSIYSFALICYRLILILLPLGEGEIPENSREEFGYHLYLLFYLVFFYSLMRSGFVPVPLMRIIYLALGARLGDNTYSSGILLDPPFIEVGENTLVGQFSLLIPHVIEGKKLAHYPIKVGSNVTIGAHAVVMSAVTIEDNAIIATGAIVTKGTRVRSGEIWGGVPAKKIGTVEKTARC